MLRIVNNYLVVRDQYYGRVRLRLYTVRKGSEYKLRNQLSKFLWPIRLQDEVRESKVRAYESEVIRVSEDMSQSRVSRDVDVRENSA